jgi:hypothetical protein
MRPRPSAGGNPLEAGTRTGTPKGGSPAGGAKRFGKRADRTLRLLAIAPMRP